MTLGGSAICWRCTKQDCVTLSTSEADYVALAKAPKRVIWLRAPVRDFDVNLDGPRVFHEDNHGAITWSTDGIRNAKHVSIRYNFAKEQSDKKVT